MAELSKLRVALAKKLEAVPGLVQVSAYQPANPTPPCAIVMGPGEISFDKAMQRGHDDWELVVMAFVAIGGDVGSQQLLDGFVAAEGPSLAIKAVLESGDRTLGGACDNLHVSKFSGYRVYQLEGRPPFLGGEWTVRILG